jgi:alkanesulfonate monooxygenase SsuD/methylene tetrahydromethanopterin reductase-like flavin-dependent oxidoreductase (luciferase family)
VGGSPRFAAQLGLLRQPEAKPQGYTDFVADVFALLEGTWASSDGVTARAAPGEGALVEPWILGSSGGESATVAGQLGALRDVTGADELLVTTITHDHADRVRSYELLAEEWVQA